VNGVILLIMFIVTGIQNATSSPELGYPRACTVEAQVSPMSLAKGDYLDDRFLQRLRLTLSPSSATRQGENQLARVSPDGAVGIGTWFDGWASLRMSPTGVSWLSGDPYSTTTCHIIIPDSKHFTFNLSTEAAALGFTHVGDVEEFVARLLFVGVYDDEHGHVWRFSVKGRYQRHDRKGTYALQGDDSGFYHDCVWLDGVRYEFVRTTESLKLYQPETRGQRDAVLAYSLRVHHQRVP
jgi:hypothetical protein